MQKKNQSVFRTDLRPPLIIAVVAGILLLAAFTLITLLVPADELFIYGLALCGVYSVTIVHGKGTGALRKGLWEFFRKDSRIRKYRNGEYGEGDFGVTVIELKGL